MAYGMIVQLPVTGTLGTDDDFDLRVLLERELGAALMRERAGACDRGETEGGRTSVYLTEITDPALALRLVTGVLARQNVLHRATVVLETPCETDPDDTDRTTLWPAQPAPARVA